MHLVVVGVYRVTVHMPFVIPDWFIPTPGVACGLRLTITQAQGTCDSVHIRDAALWAPCLSLHEWHRAIYIDVGILLRVRIPCNPQYYLRVWALGGRTLCMERPSDGRGRMVQNVQLVAFHYQV